ncbi:UDP-GlcNAc:betaGal beta-1,3-N-acetylglucosaminyltransferase-like protein 1 [Armadillidium vulgare]|nr:UDP-GlcNAc:betaGal beta-1,3-N-acetylglucosaminyltransferase-like protein 1 [Armadillidium vulgare]
MPPDIDVSIILPIYNAGQWLDECLSSILVQEHDLKIEVSIFFDSCTDNSVAIFEKWVPKFQEDFIEVKISKEENDKPKGVGYAKNKCVEQSNGEYLCFLDADDIMLPNRLRYQYNLAVNKKDELIGCKFRRIPEGSTNRFTKWANSLTKGQLNTQIFTSNGPTIIMPTWFCHRSVYDKRTIWDIRVKELEDLVLNKWEKFTIWNAGKQGRKLYRSLRKEYQKKVTCFCDVDVNKIGTFYTYELSDEKPKTKIPIVHFREAKPPFILCMKLDLTKGVFEENLASLRLTEGEDYHHFN